MFKILPSCKLALQLDWPVANSQDPQKWYDGPLYKWKLAVNQESLHFIDQLRWEKTISKCNSESQGNSYTSCLRGAETKMPGFLATVELNLNIQQAIEILPWDNL